MLRGFVDTFAYSALAVQHTHVFDGSLPDLERNKADRTGLLPECSDVSGARALENRGDDSEARRVGRRDFREGETRISGETRRTQPDIRCHVPLDREADDF